MHRIEICGGIASGKTTLAALLENTGARPVFENFDNNPFLKDFYSAPTKYALETELSFVLEHFHNIQKYIDQEGWYVYDTSFLLHLSYATANLRIADFEDYKRICVELSRRCRVPEILIVLVCSELEQRRRIKARGRPLEQNLEPLYILAVNENIRRYAATSPDAGKVILLDTENIDYEYDLEAQRAVANSIRQLMTGGTFGQGH